MHPRVFISYRRLESILHADLLKEYLDERLGSNNVFFDTDSIVHGADFVRVIEDAIAQCTCLIALIDPNWTSGMDEAIDYVRFEIETALKLDVPVLPVFLAEVSKIPDPLPPSIAAIRTLSGIPLRSRRHERLQDLAAVHSSVMRLEGERVRRAASREPATSFDKNSHADAEDLATRGLNLLRNQEIDDGIGLLRLAAQNGSVRACNMLVKIHGGGVIRPQDLREVSKWLVRAAELGDKESRFMVGMCYAYGIGVEQDFQAAERWLLPDAAAGDSSAKSLLDEVRSPLKRWNLKAMAKLKVMEMGVKQDLRESWQDLNSPGFGY